MYSNKHYELASGHAEGDSSSFCPREQVNANANLSVKRSEARILCTRTSEGRSNNPGVILWWSSKVEPRLFWVTSKAFLTRCFQLHERPSDGNSSFTFESRSIHNKDLLRGRRHPFCATSCCTHN